MPRSAPAILIDLDRARAHWHRIQGLAEPAKGSLEEVISATGLPRTLGGVDVYLAVRARVPGLRRADLDAAVERSDLQVIPAVRGCIYLAPRAHVPLLLRVAAEQSKKRTEAELAKVGVPEKEIASPATTGARSRAGDPPRRRRSARPSTSRTGRSSRATG